jgi:hypothetical protein
MRDGGQGARISFPEALQLANRCWCGSDARFYCQRPDWLRVPKSKYQHTRLRVSCQRPDWLQVPILILVNKPTQTMTVTVDGHVRYRWRVSTGATQYSTPAGSYTPFRMEPMHYSREWDNAGMPHAIFFTRRGHSIHGSDNPGLGTAVSHGCVRPTLSHAATLYQLVGSVGMAKTKVVVSGRDPPGYRRPTMPPRQPVGPFGGFFRF